MSTSKPSRKEAIAALASTVKINEYPATDLIMSTEMRVWIYRFPSGITCTQNGIKYPVYHPTFTASAVWMAFEEVARENNITVDDIMSDTKKYRNQIRGYIPKHLASIYSDVEFSHGYKPMFSDENFLVGLFKYYPTDVAMAVGAALNKYKITDNRWGAILRSVENAFIKKSMRPQ